MNNALFRKLALGAVATAACFALAGCGKQNDSSQNEGKAFLLTGQILSGDGKPVTGATISARISGQPVTISVFSGADGKYYFPELPAGGNYIVTAQLVGYKGVAQTVSVDAGVNQANFAFSDTTNFLPQLSGWQQLAGLPEDTREDRRGKAMVLRSCGQCHQTSHLFARRFDEKGWEAMIGFMPTMMGIPPEATPLVFNTHKAELARYLAKVAGPGPSPVKLKVPTRPEGDALHAVVYEYMLSSSDGRWAFNTGNDWSKGPPVFSGVGTSIHDAVVDWNGNPWFSVPGFVPGRTIGKIDAKTGAITSFSLPSTLPDKKSGRSHAMVVDREGLIWFNYAPDKALMAKSLATVDPATGKITVYDTPAGMPGVGGFVGPDGKNGIWSAAGGLWSDKAPDPGQHGAFRFDKATKTFKFFRSPTDGMIYDVAGDRDGNGWWANINKDILTRGDRATGKVTEFKLPFSWHGAPFLRPGDMSQEEFLNITVGVGPVPHGGSQMPRRMASDPNADVIWVANWGANMLMRVDTKTNKMTEFAPPYAGMNVYEPDVDANHKVWVGLQNGDEVARFDPDTGKWTIYPLPTKGVSPRGLTVTDRNGKLEVMIPALAAHKVIKLMPGSAAAAAKLKALYAKFER